MKVLLINNFHYRKGGTETVYFGMADMLRRHGHEVIFFSCLSSRNESDGVNDFFVPNNYDVPKICGAARYVYNRRAARSLDALLSKHRPDIAHIHLFWGGLSSSILSVLKRHRIPIVHTAHDYRMICPAYVFRRSDIGVCEECRGRNFRHCMLHRCSHGSLIESTVMAFEMWVRNNIVRATSKIDGFLFVSHFSHEKHKQYMPQVLGQAKSMVSYNNAPPIDEQFISRKRGDYMLYFGRLSGEKGLKTLLRATAKHPALKLKIVGTGPDDMLLQSYAASLNLRNVEFLGFQSGDALRRLICEASFVILPSEWYENNPLTIIESYAAGVPVIGAKIGGIPEIIEDGKTGYFFESGNADELSTVISRALALNDEQYAQFSKAAREFAAKHFDEEQNYQKIMEFYNQILADYVA